MIVIKDFSGDKKNLLEDVIKSATATLRNTYAPNKKALDNKARINRDLKRLIAEIDSDIIGTVQYFIDNDKLHLLGLAVNETQRKKGVAKALIGQLIEKAKENNVHFLCLYTVKETGNGEVFRKLGFHVVSEKIDEYSISDRYAELHEVYMELRLQQEKK